MSATFTLKISKNKTAGSILADKVPKGRDHVLQSVVLLARRQSPNILGDHKGRTLRLNKIGTVLRGLVLLRARQDEESIGDDEYREVARTGVVAPGNDILDAAARMPSIDPEKARRLKDVKLVVFKPNDPEDPRTWSRGYRWCKHQRRFLFV